MVNSLEETFDATKNWTIMMLDSFRDYHYADFDFTIESQELVTINELDTCKYTGKHTYTLDGVAQEIPFVAYSFDTGVIENYSYITVIVMDDSINNPSMEPLPEGTIEAYAKKMVESVVVKDGFFRQILSIVNFCRA